MATNPIRKEENKWTPKSIFDINLGDIPIPLESIFSQGSDGVNVDEAKESLETGSSSFFKNFLSNAVNKVAEAFSPNGDKHYIIEEAVIEQISPTYDAIEEAQKAQKELADQVAESVATQETILAESQDALAKAEEAAQSVGGVETELEKAQNELLAQGVRFDEEQTRVNRLVQDMIWNQQDTLEIVELRSQKTFGWLWGDIQNQPKSHVPGLSHDEYSNPNSKNQLPYAETPYFKIWLDKRDVYVAAAKKWGGNLRVSINWTNGAVDDWNVLSSLEGGEAFHFYGGSLTISVRSVNVEVQTNVFTRRSSLNIYPELNGGVVFTESEDPFWDSIRDCSVGEESIFRTKTAVRTTGPTVVRDADGGKTLYDSYETIPAGSYIYFEDNKEEWQEHPPTPPGDAAASADKAHKIVVFDEYYLNSLPEGGGYYWYAMKEGGHVQYYKA